nr:Glycerophosphoryl diester phosphodiesterase precursor [Klebsiella pneumoniae]
MKMKLTALMSGMILSSSALCFSATAADKMVIAHRGASGYLPEHTLPAKAMAYAQGRITLSKTGDDQRRPAGGVTRPLSRSGD